MELAVIAVASSCALLAAAMNMAGCRPWLSQRLVITFFGNESITIKGVSTLSHVTGRDVRTGIDTSHRNLAKPPTRPIDPNVALHHLEPLVPFK